MNASGDEVWILDQDERIISYVAWNTAGAGFPTDPPPASFELWDPTGLGDANLGGVPSGRSISLATIDGAGRTNPTCWEWTGSGDATCAEAVSGTTLDTDSSSRVASPGQANIS